MNNNQAYIFNKMKLDIQKYIHDTESKINAISRLKFYPKKDGKDKADFDKNFGLDIGEKFTIKWCTREESRRYVKIAPFYRHIEDNNKIPSRIDLDIARVMENEKETLPFTEHYIYIENNDDAKKFFEKEGFSANSTFKLITTIYKSSLETELENYKKELDDLPKMFSSLCEAANKLEEFINSTEKYTVIHRYAYNLKSSDFYQFLDN